MTAHAKSEAKTQEFNPDARYVGEDCIEYRNFADFLRGQPLRSSRNIQIRDNLQGLNEAELRIWTKAYDCEAYEGPVRRPKGCEVDITWHAHCSNAAARALAAFQRTLPGCAEGAGRAHPGSPAPDPVHAAHQPALHGGVGA